MSKVKEIETKQGLIVGRDSVYMKGTEIDERFSKFKLTTDSNIGGVRYSGVIFTFNLSLAMKRTLLDSWLYSDGSPNLAESTSFFETLNSDWIASLKELNDGSYRHITLQTYDFVYEFACEDFEVVIPT